MRLVRYLFFLEARFGFELVAAHLPGRVNMLAYDLSRNHRYLTSWNGIGNGSRDAIRTRLGKKLDPRW